MPNSKRFVQIIVGVIIVLAALKIFNIIPISGTDFSAAVLTLIGIGVVQNNFNGASSLSIFFGSSIFFTGIIIFLHHNFLFVDQSLVMWIALPLICGFNLLILFLNKPNEKIFFYTAFLLLSCGFGLIMYFGIFNITGIINSSILIIKDYYTLLIAILIFLIVLSKR